MKFVIEGHPIPWKRPGGRTHRYDMQKAQKAKIRASFLEQWNAAFESENKEIQIEASNLAMAESFVVYYTFLFPISDFESTGQKNAKLWGFIPHNTKPDTDNLIKFYSDCGNGVLWKDDAQIVNGGFKKLFDENPRTEIVIMCKRKLNINSDVESVFRIFGPNKFKQFIEDASLFNKINSERIGVLTSSDFGSYKENFLSSAATLLMNFANSYSDDLKKVKNIKKS